MFALIGKDFSMSSGKKFIVLVLSALVLALAWMGGTWTTTQGATQGQSTLPTITPTREPPDTPTPTRVGAPPPSFPIPLIFIVSVVPGESVTIRTANFPPNTDFDVLMNYYGTLGIGGEKVATVNSGSGGVLTWTFNIPSFLKDAARIAIRLQSQRGYYSYNWFWNKPTSGTGQAPSKPFVIPTFKIIAVERDKTVTIQTANFPANDTFDVLMNYYGTLGIGGIKVDQVNSGSGGTLTFTFNIPEAMRGQTKIAIRLQSPTSGYYAYNWFWNNSTSEASIPPSTPPAESPLPSLPPGVIPTFRIQSVVRDTSVTIVTSNFPQNDTFDVLMNNYGTLGINGVKVETISSGSGGTLTLTFTIPESMRGKSRIAIRLQSSKSGYYAYNWFWNNTYP